MDVAPLRGIILMIYGFRFPWYIPNIDNTLTVFDKN